VTVDELKKLGEIKEDGDIESITEEKRSTIFNNEKI
jgi:hypothetical protein